MWLTIRSGEAAFVFTIDETKPVMIQVARIVGREPPFIAAILHLITSDLRDLSDMSKATL